MTVALDTGYVVCSRYTPLPPPGYPQTPILVDDHGYSLFDGVTCRTYCRTCNDAARRVVRASGNKIDRAASQFLSPSRLVSTLPVKKLNRPALEATTVEKNNSIRGPGYSPPPSQPRVFRAATRPVP